MSQENVEIVMGTLVFDRDYAPMFRDDAGWAALADRT
jgi:hypothetical protein